MIDKLKPYLWFIEAAAFVAALVASFFLWSSHNASQQKIGYDRAMDEVKTAQAKIAEKKRAGEIADQNQVNQEASNAQDQLDNLGRERDLARADADRMRQQYRQAVERGRKNLACAPGASKSEPGSDPLGVFADLLERAEKRADEVAGYADQLRITGGACERIYDEMRN